MVTRQQQSSAPGRWLDDLGARQRRRNGGGAGGEGTRRSISQLIDTEPLGNKHVLKTRTTKRTEKAQRRLELPDKHLTAHFDRSVTCSVTSDRMLLGQLTTSIRTASDYWQSNIHYCKRWLAALAIGVCTDSATIRMLFLSPPAKT